MSAVHPVTVDLDDCPIPEDLLSEALRIVRRQTMLLATRKHLEAMSQNRDSLIVELRNMHETLSGIAKEIEASCGPMPTTRAQLAGLLKRIEIEEAA